MVNEYQGLALADFAALASAFASARSSFGVVLVAHQLRCHRADVHFVNARPAGYLHVEAVDQLASLALDLARLEGGSETVRSAIARASDMVIFASRCKSACVSCFLCVGD